MKLAFISFRVSFDRNLISLSGTSQHRLARAQGIVSFAVGLILLAAFCIPAEAQVTLAPYWNQLSPAASPTPRDTQALAYDATHGQVVMFGGFNGSYLSDTWLWNGTTWTQASPMNSPSPRSNEEMAYDPATGNVVLFGGLNNGSTRYNDTWIWDGTNWTNVTPNPVTSTNNPPGRASASMVYDAATGNVVMFGGLDTNGAVLGDTWIWNGTSWSQASPAISPSARSSYAMTYDAAHGQVVLFGGEDGSLNYFNDTWTWDGTNWTAQNPLAPLPTVRNLAGMAYDPALGEVVLFGGRSGSTYLNDTWIWNGTAWTQGSFTPSPSTRVALNALTYDATENELILFGGANSTNVFGDTWTFGFPQNFGNVNVCSGSSTPSPCSSTLALTFNFPQDATITSIQVVTQGATGFDFVQANGGNCAGAISAGNSCTLDVTFTPLAPGLRLGAVQLLVNSGGANQLVSTPIYGNGQGPVATFSPLTTFVESTGPYTLSGPKGVAVDVAGDIFMADTGNGRVVEAKAGGANGYQTVGTGLVSPQALAVDGAGDLFIADPGLNSPNGEVLEVPAGCATGTCQVPIYAPQGPHPTPVGVAVDGLGDIFIADNPNGVFEIPANGSGQTLLYNPTGSQPTGVAVDGAGDLFISDSGLHQVVEYPAGCGSSCQKTIGLGWAEPASVALDAAGDVIVADPGLDEVVEVPVGCTIQACQITLAFPAMPSLAGTFQAYDAVPDYQGNIFIADVANNRIDSIYPGLQAFNFAESSAGNQSGDSPRSVLFQNIGNQTLSATGQGLVFLNPSFTQTSGPGTPGTPPDCNPAFSLGAGAACNLSVNFDPLSNGTVTGYADFYDNSLNNPTSLQSFPFTGTGTAFGTEYALTVTEVGSGAGAVTDNFTSINCSQSNATCSATYVSGAPVTLTATPSGGASFLGWGGACASSGTSTTCNLIMNSSTNVAANFGQQSFGNINLCPSSGIGQPPCTSTQQVTFTATATVANAVVTVVTQGSPALDFSLAGMTCPGTILANTSCTINVTFTPLAPGLRLGAVEISGFSNGNNGLVATIPISGIGEAPENAYGPDSPASVSLGNYSLSLPVAVDAGGNIYFTASGELWEKPSAGVVQTLSSGPFYAAAGLAVDGAGDVFVADSEQGKVFKVAANGGALTTVYPAQGSNGVPRGLAVDGEGDVFVADSFLNEVVEIPANGDPQTVVYSAASSFSPTAVAVDAAGDLFIAIQNGNPGQGQVVEIPAGCGSSNCQTTVGTGWYLPSSLAVDAAGDVFVADPGLAGGNGELTEVTPSCKGANASATCQYILANGSSIGGGVNSYGIALDGQGDVYYVNTGSNENGQGSLIGQLYELPRSQLPSLNFGTTTAAGIVSNPQAVTIQNIGNQTLSISDLAVGSPFDQIFNGNDNPVDCSNGGNFNLTASQSCTLNISFEPPAAQFYSAYVSLTDDSLNSDFYPFQQINLAGTATAGIATDTIAVTELGTGAGTVTSTPPGISCSQAAGGTSSGTCSANLTAGSQVTLTAVAAAGSIFLGWGTPCSGTSPTCTVNVNGNYDVSANFVQGDFGAVSVCAGGSPLGCAGNTIPVTFNFTGNAAVSQILAFTQGSTGLDFTAPNSGQCINNFSSGQSCTVNVTFTPTAPGLRMGAVELLGDTGQLIATQFVSGIGQGSAVAFSPGTQTTVSASGLNYPAGVALDGAGNLYIANYGSSNRAGYVVKVTPGGVQTTVLSAYTAAPGQAPAPVGVAVDGAGNLFIVDLGLSYAVKVTPSGVQTSVGSGLNYPIGIALDGAGDVFIGDQNNARVVEVTPGGVQTTVPFTGLQQPWGVAVDAAGDVFVADGGNSGVMPAVPPSVMKLTPSGVQTTVPATGLKQPYDLAVDAAGDVIIADAPNSRVVEVTPSGVQTTVGSGLNYPSGVTVDAAGDIFIGDQGAQEVFEVNQSQPELWNFGSVNVGGRSNDVGYSIQNVGNQNLTGSVGSASNANFAVDLINSTCTSVNGISLAPGAACLVGIYAQPTGSGLVTGTVPVSDNSLNGSPATQAIPVEVTGLGATYALTVTDIGTGSGSVTSGDGLIGCVDTNGVVTGSPSCSANYSSGTVTLTASASAESTFLGWGGACASYGMATQCTVAMNAAENVSANFVQGDFGSNINVCPSGEIIPAPCSGTQTVAFNLAETTNIGAIQVVTQGATGLDFALGTGSTCTGTISAGNSCNVSVSFTPLAPGLRTGAVELYDMSGNLVATAPIFGVGQAPAAAFNPVTQTTINTGSVVLSTPKGLLADAAGNLFISDTGEISGNPQVVKIAPNGTETVFGPNLPTPLLFPQGMAEDGAGNLFIADNNLNGVVEIPAGCNSSCVQEQILPNPLNLRSQLGVAVDGAGDLFIGDFEGNEVAELPANGGTQTVVYNPTPGCGTAYPGCSHPIDLTTDAAGDLFVADYGLATVAEVPAGCTSGGCVKPIGIGWSQPDGVAVDAAGDVFVADAGLSEVVEVPAGCTTTLCQIVLVNGVNTVAVKLDATGHLFVDNLAASQILEVTRSLPPSFSFALTNVSSPSAPQSVSIQNVGNQPLTGSLNLSLLGANFTQNATPDCSGAFPLAPGATCSESFSFTPQTTGYLAGTASFSDNTLNLSPLVALQSVNLSGNGGLNGQAVGVLVPNVVGLTQAAGTTVITGAGLAPGTVSTASSSIIPSGSVIASNPAAGTQVMVGATVRLLVSTGQAQPPTPNPLSFENNYFVTGDYASAGTSLRGLGSAGGLANGTINIPDSTTNPSAGPGVPDGADIVDGFLYWETLENTPSPSGGNGTFLGYPITGQQIGSDLPYNDSAHSGTLRVYRADVNTYFPVGTNGIRFGSGAFPISLPDGGSTFPFNEGASLVVIYRVLSPNFPLKSVVIYDGSAIPAGTGAQIVQGFYDSTGTGENTILFNAGGTWNSGSSSIALPAHANQFSAPLNAGSAYAAVIVSTPVTNSDNDGILDAWKAGPAAGDFFAGQPGYYDVKTGSWVPLPGAVHGEKDLFVQLDYMCGNVLSSGACDPTQENLFPAPDPQGNDPLAMVTNAFAAPGVGIHLHLEIGNAVPEDSCTDNTSTSPPLLCQFPSQPGVIGWKNSLEFSKLWPRNFASCAAGIDCSPRFPYGQKDSYHYVLFGHSLAIPAWNSRYGSLTSINVVSGQSTIVTTDRGTGINYCPSRITISGVLGNPGLNGVYNTSSCPNSTTMIVATPNANNWSYSYPSSPEPEIGITSGTVTSISGYSDLGGADSAVTLGLWETAPNQDMSKRASVIAGTLFHEIGHTLGLSHGGLYYDTTGSYIPTFDVNCKPNYQSSMNYLFQLDGVGPGAAVAYSNQTLATLTDASLNTVTQLATADVPPVPATFSTSAWYTQNAPNSTASPATLHCDGTPLAGDTGYRVNGPIAPITPAWSNGQNITFDGVPYSTLRGYNDVANIDLRQLGATGGEFASLASVLSFGSSTTPLTVAAGGNVTLGGGGTVTLGGGGSVTLSSGGNVTLGSAGTITPGSGGSVTLNNGGSVTLSTGGTITPANGGTVTLGSGGTVTLGGGGTITLGGGGTVTLGGGGTVTLGGGGTITSSAGSVTIPSTGGSYTLPDGGGMITLGGSGTVTLGGGGTVTLGGGGTIAMGGGGTVTLGGGGTVTLGGGGTVALGGGGTVTLGGGGNVTLGGGGTVTLGGGGTVTLGGGGTVTLGGGGTVTLGGGGNVTLGGGGNVTLGVGGTVTLGGGGSLTLTSAGSVTLSSGGTITSGGSTQTVPAGTYNVSGGGTVTLGGGGTVTLGGGGNVTLGGGGVVALGGGGTVTLGGGGTIALGGGGNVTLGGGGASTAEMDYNTANSIVRPPSLPTETQISTPTQTSVVVNWTAPAFGVVATYTISRGSETYAPFVVGSVSGVNGNPPATTFTDTNPDLTSQMVSYTISTTLLPIPVIDPTPRQSLPSSPAVQTNNQTIVLGSLPSSVALPGPQPISATAESNGVANGLQVNFSATGPCSIGSQSPPDNNGASSASVILNGTGSCIVTASQAGTNLSQPGPQPYYNAADPVSGTFTILPQGSNTQSQTILFPQLPNVQYGGTFSLSASTTPPGQTVSFTASGPCMTSGKTTGVGLCSITASVPAYSTANATYSAASLTQSFTIYPAVFTVTAINQTSAYGQALPALTYTTSPLVNGDPSTAVTGSPALSTTATATSSVGSYPITVSTGTLAAANYSFLFVSGKLTIGQAKQAIALNNVPASAPNSSSFTVTATGGASGNPVMFTSSGVCSITGTTPGTATYTMNSSTGTCSVIANQAGNTNYSAAPTVTQIVNATAPVFTVSPSNINFGTVAQGSVTTKSITVTNSGTASVTINQPFISIVQGGNSNEFVAVNLCPSSLGAGKSCTITITFIAGPYYTQQTATLKVMDSAPGSPQTVTLGALVLIPQTITFTTNPPASATYNGIFTVAATGGGSGNAVNFTSSGVCSITGTTPGTATYTMKSGTGTCSVIANQAGNSSYAAASQVTKTVSATLAPQAITFTPNPPSSAAYKSSFMVTATGGGSGIGVTFTSSGSCSNAGATYTMTKSTGTCSVIANQAGNSNYAAAPQVTKIVTATLAPQTIAFSTNAPANAAYKSTFTVAATGGGSGNAVTFTSSGACSNSGATYTMNKSTGTCSVIANQAGNSNYAAAPQVTETVNATLAPQTITFTKSPPGSAPYKSSFTVAATGGASGNAVTFTSSGSCSNSGATYTMTSGTGTCSVIANQAGNSNYAAAAQVTKTVTATLVAQTITFTTNPPATAALNSSFTVAATASSGLAVTFTSSGACSNSGPTYKMTSGTGTCSVIANQAGNSNYSAAAQVTKTVTAKQ